MLSEHKSTVVMSRIEKITNKQNILAISGYIFLVLIVNKSVFKYKSTFFCPEKTDLL